jgi:hypothetical protein
LTTSKLVLLLMGSPPQVTISILAETFATGFVLPGAGCGIGCGFGVGPALGVGGGVADGGTGVGVASGWAGESEQLVKPTAMVPSKKAIHTLRMRKNLTRARRNHATPLMGRT